MSNSLTKKAKIGTKAENGAMNHAFDTTICAAHNC